MTKLNTRVHTHRWVGLYMQNSSNFTRGDIFSTNVSLKMIYFVCIIIVAALQRQTTVQKPDTNVREFLKKLS